jgi:hypothetical protein
MIKIQSILALLLVVLLAVSALAADRVVVIPLGGASKSAGDAGTEHVLEGKTFSSEVLYDQPGDMPNIGRVNFEPGRSNQTVPRGYHNGLGVVYGSTALIGANIRVGTSIFDVVGTYKCANMDFRYDQDQCTLNCAGEAGGNVDFMNGCFRGCDIMYGKVVATCQ